MSLLNDEKKLDDYGDRLWIAYARQAWPLRKETWREKFVWAIRTKVRNVLEWLLDRV